MKAAVLRALKQPLAIEEIDIDHPRGREVLVRVAASGVCYTDHKVADGILPSTLPVILGHEGAGVVEEVGPEVSYVRPGEHVLSFPSAFCGSCEFCLAGRPNLCINRTILERSPAAPHKLSSHGERLNQMGGLGTFAQRLLVHENYLVKIEDDIPLDRAALLGCGVATGLGAALNTAKVAPGSTVAVFGTGGVGLSIVQGARIAGARQIIAIDLFAPKLELARRMGATHTVDASVADPVEAVRQMTAGGVDYAFTGAGSTKVVEQAFSSSRAGATTTIVGFPGPGQIMHLEAYMFFTERKLIGCQMGSTRARIDLPHYLELYRQGRLNLDDMISRRMGLEDVNEALAALSTSEIARQVLMFN